MPAEFHTMLILAANSNAALVCFLAYMVGVFLIAAAANRLLKDRDFLSEYFLGSRGLGMWAFALTYAATSASGGTFTGFPAKIYTHGWVLALWISSYMVVPICTMALIGKRVNQVARRAGAITIPDVLRDRFDNRAFGLLSTSLIVFFLAFNLVAQFKAGSLILNTLLADVPLYRSSLRELNLFLGGHREDWWMQLFLDPYAPLDTGYLVCLFVFGVTVIAYTTYGGFHAVVWTDVMQGIVMVAGVLIMLPLALYQVGGLGVATREMVKMTPPRSCEIMIEVNRPAPGEFVLRRGTVIRSYVSGESAISNLSLASGEEIQVIPVEQRPRLFRTTEPLVQAQVIYPMQVAVKALEITTPSEVDRFLADHPLEVSDARAIAIAQETSYAYGAGNAQPGAYVSLPGPSATDANGFLPLGAAISFFFMWAISGTGQPQYMVRLMAFKDSQTLKRAIVTVTVYMGLIYFPLVIIFCCARVLMPGLEYDPDSIMPRMAVYLTETAGLAWLAGILIAAPFAAVMSTVDSFLLVVSSSLVRDIWQRNVNPNASEAFVKRLSYFTTLVVGAIAMIGAIDPPLYLQDIIVYAGSGLAACFLFPVVAALYWPRANAWGSMAGMLAGFGVHLAMHVIGMLQPGGQFENPYHLFGLSPVVVGLASSFLATLIVTLVTPAPAQQLVQKYFGKTDPVAMPTT